ncbi:MAG: beta-CASP ribonuclease aCPSF1 [Candidatus Woesearchaeota archaeon]
MTSNILKEIMKIVPEDKISEAGFEGANIVLYTKDKDFFLEDRGLIKKAVHEFKKRVELRPDPTLCMGMQHAEDIIKNMLPEEAAADNIIFDPQRSIVIIEAEKPGLAIGKQGQNLRDIKEKTMWVPVIKRTPAIRSQLIEDIRSVLYQNNDYRKKFLNQTGHRVYDGWIRGKKNEWVRISFLGGARQVGRSCLLLQTPESRIMLDCGIDVAANDSSAYPYLEAPEFKIDELDAVIVSHAHLDHCGLIPYLIKFGYKGPIYCTTPTRDVMALLQLDLIKIMVSEGKDPLYKSDDVKEMVKQTITLDYEEVTDVTPDVRITMYNSGHILGSSMIHLHIGNGLHNLLYTGDMKFTRSALLDGAITSFPRLETLIIESTYGAKDNNMPTRQQCEDEFVGVIKETLENKGKVLIPVLGVGRSQEMSLILEKVMREGQIPKVPVYVDGMVWDVTAIHTAYPEYLNSNVRKMIFHKNQNPFLSEIFKRVGSKKERTQIIEEGGPCIILATSGMLVGGASVQYFKELSGNPKNSLIFVNYQGEGSLGRRVQRGEKEFQFNEGGRREVSVVKMRIATVEGFSGHADRNELFNFLRKSNPRPKRVIIGHGESSRCLDLASSLHKQFRIETNAPRNLEVIRIV